MLVKKKGIFTEEDALKVIEMANERLEREIIVMAYKVTDAAKRRLWDYQKALALMSDLTGEKREVRIEILEGYVSDKVKGIELK
ncbi:hypothetical protein PNA2_0123 [Pyrococcus sp. NA2]|uniref:hypothetical protein n=1 Tax=Pyrococcus sp. (strain NA2) TaxID=342949 RepID=UPI000209AE59|nr:hypothetical protein [Pyrococcus sp. NA2]AEC51041.1 hypothetical protein PNA2_0123 [Pyrococcus sp. NA2]